MKQKIVIEANAPNANYWKDLWSYRGLFYFLAWRDILVRYKQTAIGIAWSVIRPLLTLIVFTVVFGKLAKFPSHGVPYVLLVYSALLPWQFFSTAFSEASNSLIANSNILSKVYFPRIIVPISTIIVSLIDFFISLVLLVFIMLWYNFVPQWQIVLLPLFLLFSILISMGFGLLIASLNVKYRDFRFIVPFVVQLGLYISPVGFSSGIVPEKWKMIYSLNPMVGVIDGFRWCILGGESQIYMPGFLISIAITILFLILGVMYFRKTERTFADDI